MKYALGIDLGTTSSKVSIINAFTETIVVSHTEATHSYDINNECRSEQNPGKILNALQRCVSRIPSDVLRNVISIGICGQLHGMLLWNSDCKFYENETIIIRKESVSQLYTWQDGRCDAEFLSSLPKPDSHLALHSGYGCCTLFWLAKNQPEKIKSFAVSGTIADFVVCILCDIDGGITSSHSAASWGYYNAERNEWNENILKLAAFPTGLLPKILDPSAVAGKLAFPWLGIPAGTVIKVGMGDLQCGMLAAVEKDTDVFVNISTSAQLAYVDKEFSPRTFDDSNSCVKHVPYFGKTYIAETALLNGGNALAYFSKAVRNLLKDFGCNLDESQIWKHFTKISQMESPLIVKPLFLGERDDPKGKALIKNIAPDNFTIDNLYVAFCEGIIANISRVTPVEELVKQKIERIVGGGSLLLRNQILRKKLQEYYSLPIIYKEFADAPYGAALASLNKKMIISNEK